MRTLPTIAGVLLVAVAVWVVAPSAQQPPQAPTFRADISRVLVTALVTERDVPVEGLTAADFELLDNSVPQQIAAAQVRSQPIDVTLVLDPSLSVASGALPQFVADVQRMATSLGPDDRARLMTAGTTVMDLTGLRPGGSSLPTNRLAVGGATALYDALTAALILSNRVDRTQLVFGFSDGLDSMSFLDAERVVALARRSAASLYLSIAETSLTIKPTYASGTAYIGGPNRNLLREMSEATGGAVFTRAAGTPLSQTFASVMDRFRSGYVLTFVPTGVAATGWHDLTVRTKDRRYTVRARRGYEGG